MATSDDCTALAVVHEEGGFFVLDDMQVWEGRRGEPVNIAKVEATIATIANRFPIHRVVSDPWQMASTIQRFNGRIEEFRFSSTSVARLSSNLLNVITTVRWALNGENVDELVPLLSERDPAVLAQHVTRMSVADASIVRAFFTAYGCCGVTDPVHDLSTLGLITETA